MVVVADDGSLGGIGTPAPTPIKLPDGTVILQPPAAPTAPTAPTAAAPIYPIGVVTPPPPDYVPDWGTPAAPPEPPTTPTTPPTTVSPGGTTGGHLINDGYDALNTLKDKGVIPLNAVLVDYNENTGAVKYKLSEGKKGGHQVQDDLADIQYGAAMAKLKPYEITKAKSTGQNRAYEVEGYDIAKFLRQGGDESVLKDAGFGASAISEAKQYNNRPLSMENYIKQYAGDHNKTIINANSTIEDPNYLGGTGKRKPYPSELKAQEAWVMEARREYVAKYGKKAVAESIGAEILSPVFSPARALAPDVTIKDISKGEWVTGAAQVALFVVAPVSGAVIRGGTGVVVSKSVQLAAGGVFLKDTVDNWSTMSPTERAVSVVMDALIIGSALPSVKTVKALKENAKVSINEFKMQPEAGYTKLDLPEYTTTRIKTVGIMDETVEASMKTEMQNIQQAIRAGDDYAVSRAGTRIKELAKGVKDAETREALIKYADNLEKNSENIIKTTTQLKNKVTKKEVQKTVDSSERLTQMAEQTKTQQRGTTTITKERPKIEDWPVRPETPEELARRQMQERLQKMIEENKTKIKAAERPGARERQNVTAKSKSRETEQVREEAIKKYQEQLKNKDKAIQKIKRKLAVSPAAATSTKTATPVQTQLMTELETKQKEQLALQTQLLNQLENQPATETQTEVKPEPAVAPFTETKPDNAPKFYPEQKPDNKPAPDEKPVPPQDQPKPPEDNPPPPEIKPPPPPPPPPPKGERPKKLPKGDEEDDKKKKKGIILKPGSLAWEQGKLGKGKNQKEVVKYIEPPYTKRKTLVGVYPEGYKDTGDTPATTIQTIGGPVKRKVDVPIGITTAHADPDNKRITFTSNNGKVRITESTEPAKERKPYQGRGRRPNMRPRDLGAGIVQDRRGRHIKLY